MRRTKEAAREFLDCRRIAVTGVSRTSGSHGGNIVYQRLRDRGYEVAAINPNAEEVEGDPAFPDLASAPAGIEAVVIATAPEHAKATVRECVELGIDKVWMHQGPGPTSVSPDATAIAREHGIEVIDGGCPLMFGPTADVGHKCIRAVLSLTRRVPKHV